MSSSSVARWMRTPEWPARSSIRRQITYRQVPGGPSGAGLVGPGGALAGLLREAEAGQAAQRQAVAPRLLQEQVGLGVLARLAVAEEESDAGVQAGGRAARGGG